MVKPKVICLGLGKTGTTTFSRAMRKAGYRHLTGPLTLGLGLWKMGEVSTLFDAVEGFDSFDDFPWPYLADEAQTRWPDARFVLTRRASAEAWYKSLLTHSWRMGPTDNFWMAYGCYTPDAEKERLMALYEDHNAAIRRRFAAAPPDRFIEICWEEEGAEAQLAAFLGVSEEQVRVPRANVAADKDLTAYARAFCDEGRFGTAIRLTETQGGRDDLASIVRDGLRAETRRFERSDSVPARVLRKLTGRVRRNF